MLAAIPTVLAKLGQFLLSLLIRKAAKEAEEAVEEKLAEKRDEPG